MNDKNLLTLLLLVSCCDTGVGYDKHHDLDGDGYEAGEDCDDHDASIHPGAEEACNGRDDDCDHDIDEYLPFREWYLDADGDGHGDPDHRELACGAPAGHVADGSDCDDDAPGVHPGGTETAADGVDGDCDGLELCFLDGDRDGHGSTETVSSTDFACTGPEESTANDDCADEDAGTHPGAGEICDALDNDCDGLIDEEASAGGLVCCADADGDLFGDPSLCLEACTCPPAYVVDATDCDDHLRFVNPGAVEACDDHLDNDCDGATDLDCLPCDFIVPVDFASVQEAIDWSETGDLVCVAAGTWYENLDFGGADIEVLGVHGWSVTFLHGHMAGPVVTFASGEGPGARLAGFTLLHGYRPDGGGGVWIEGASPTLEDLIVTHNTAWSTRMAGGGIRIDGGHPSLSRVIVTENTAWIDSTYTYGSGGGLALFDSNAILDNVSVFRNEAAVDGGGIYLSDSDASLHHVSVVDNLSSGGGGICVDGGAPEFTNLVVVGNVSSAAESAWGGGIHLRSTSATFTNVVVVGNRVLASRSADGGGLSSLDSTAVFTNAVFSGNEAGTGGAIHVRSGSSPPTIRYCDVWANVPDEFVGMVDPTGTEGNLAVDPLFLDEALHLAADSPLSNAGDPSLDDPDGSPSDMGAFGGRGASSWDLDGDGFPAWWLPGPYDAATSPGCDCDDSNAEIIPGRGC